MNAATQNKRGRRVAATSSLQGGERGIRTPGPDFSRHGISSAAQSAALSSLRRVTHHRVSHFKSIENLRANPMSRGESGFFLFLLFLLFLWLGGFFSLAAAGRFGRHLGLLALLGFGFLGRGGRDFFSFSLGSLFVARLD